jgi:hypothetical protein
MTANERVVQTLGHSRVLAALLLAGCATLACGAELVLETSAVQTLVKRSLFTDEEGRRYVYRDGKCYAYFEYPEVTVDGGRVSIRAHFSSRIGVNAGGQCFGPGLASWVTVSGTPAVAGARLQLRQITIDKVEDDNTRALVHSGLVPALPGAIDYDVQQAVRTMLEGTKEGFQANVDTLTFSSINAQQGKLSIQFDFRLSAR